MAIKAVLFCGGRGSATIIRALLRTPDVQLALLVNAYDDGLSTGALRNFIPGMLGPSDFRKNFSYLLDLYSDEQYALKKLIEHRLPLDFGPADIDRLHKFVEGGNPQVMAEPLSGLFSRLDTNASSQVKQLLRAFLDYANGSAGRFDFGDCAVGNLIFAGAYLSQGQNFNSASEVMSRLVCSRALLVNVSKGENRILVALKDNGEILAHEVEIVGRQSQVPIRRIFFLEESLRQDDLARIGGMTVEQKEAWLAARQSIPLLSEEARRFLRDADIIIYGPGTQHSSLLPSYAIAGSALGSAKAPVKALVVNLEPDHDIQGLTASDLVDRALAYAGDAENGRRTITHILLDDHDRNGSNNHVEPGLIDGQSSYKGAAIVRGNFDNEVAPQKHNGSAVVSEILQIWDRKGGQELKPSLEIFCDLSRRPAAGPALLDEFLEFDWGRSFRRVVLRVHGNVPKVSSLPESLAVEEWRCEGSFPEVPIAANWLRAGGTDYLATITGDGEYRLEEIAFCVGVLAQGSFGAVYGSRTQSRRQFNHSLRAAYGERTFVYRLSQMGAFLLSFVFAVRFGVIFSDPMTGFRIYRRCKLDSIEALLAPGPRTTPTTITKLLVRNRIEIAELPVHYRTFAGFTDPRWRLRRGLLNLLGIFR